MTHRAPTLSEYLLAWTGGAAFVTIVGTWVALRSINEKFGPFKTLNYLVGEPDHEQSLE